MDKFNCIKCGICCKNLDKSEIYSNLDRGDGICKNLNTTSNLCNIYNNRPTICSVETMYDLFFAKIMSREEYYQKNYEACGLLLSLNKRKK